MKELISVIIPVYNVEKYLDRSLKSVINQTYRNLEIILVDDGSLDGSSKLCDEWQKRDNRIKVIHKENGGLSSARNAGLKVASGSYIGYVDSDDWIDLDMYEYLYSLIKKNKVDVAFCDFARLKAIGNKKRVQKEKVVIRSDDDLEKFFYRVYGGKSSYAVPCGLYRFRKVKDIKFVEGEINEDVLYRYEVYKRVRKIAFSNLKKYDYFINKNGITMGQLSKKDFSLLRIWDYIVEKEQGTDNYKYAVINRARATYTLYVKYLLNGNKDVEQDVLNYWKKEIKENYKLLKSGKVLDWKRKLILFYIAKM